MHPPLTPDDHRLIRNWTFAITIIYPLLMLVFFASVIVKINPMAAGASAAATGPRSLQSSSERQPPPAAGPRP